MQFIPHDYQKYTIDYMVSHPITAAICHTMELDEKYASVILRRYVEDTDDADNVYVIRNGEKLMYSDLVKEVDFGDGTTE